MANRKGNKNKATDRKVYSEFGPPEATARPEPDLPPNQQDIRVQVSRKGRKGKSVTIASGFVHNAKTLGSLAKSLKASCGSGGTVKDDTIEIQGEHAPKLLSLLIEKGYKAKISGG
ncbi:translation initiation factor [cf. Phormidesmis sp. LEGE 11477]|uniref:translation initiation factor n=1 Tax=cf. Phormidesmis sp. LEGE 11477 TaxID=1828680 RepID=UPI0018809939|nr:translation initiation factor [cf. Phormidesmis sp. LEGE 11477]MBE9060457.1 translation initiation factor [cf. Phormidesmis sp. LEGE 11477]